MTLNNFLKQVRLAYFHNLSKNSNGLVGDENLTAMLNTGLLNMHLIFNITQEQAIILVPQHRQTFKIAKSDPNVIMATFSKLAKVAMSNTPKDESSILDEIIALKDEDGNKLSPLEDKDKTTMLDGETNDNVFTYNNKDVCFRIIEVHDLKHPRPTRYSLNQENVYMVDSTTLYFPKCKEGDIIYVLYTPKPLMCDSSKLDVEIDIPDEYLKCLGAYVASQVYAQLSDGQITSFGRSYGNVFQLYNNYLQELKLVGAGIPADMTITNAKERGLP